MNLFKIDYENNVLLTMSTKESTNSKTGPVKQMSLYDVNHYETLKKGGKIQVSDGHIGSKCKNCPIKADCYTTWRYTKLKACVSKKSYKQVKSVSDWTPQSSIRLGEYGDPSSISLKDLKLIQEKIGKKDVLLGYTHFWKNIPLEYSEFLMASCETLKDAFLARTLGYRVFLVLDYKESYSPLFLKSIGFINCVFDSHKIQCVRCQLCNGKKGHTDQRRDIYIGLHGSKSKPHKSYDKSYWMMIDSLSSTLSKDEFIKFLKADNIL